MEKKGKKSGSISKDTNYKPGARVSVYQIQSYLTGLVLQLSGKLTSACIWDSLEAAAEKRRVSHIRLTMTRPARGPYS